MEVVPHADVAAFARLVRPLLVADPVRHTSLLTVLDGAARGVFPPAAMLVVSEGGRVTGALLRTGGHLALVSGVPPRHAGAVADVLARVDPDLPGAQGPAPEAEAFTGAWARCTGARVEDTLRMRLFALAELCPPAGVPGAPRLVTAPGDPAVDLLARWRAAFEAEARPPSDGPSPRAVVVDAIRSGGGELLWEVDGEPVAQASARAVTGGMTRIGPVYTPPGQRGRGYGAAVTAAASRWALDAGAAHVLLYTDLANPTTNRLYPRIGYRPVFDALEVRFGRG